MCIHYPFYIKHGAMCIKKYKYKHKYETYSTPVMLLVSSGSGNK